MAEQVAPHSIPAGAEVTVPLPVPALLTVSVKGGAAKPVLTNLDAFMVTVQVVPETASHPLQPMTVDPPVGVAVSVTTVPLS